MNFSEMTAEEKDAHYKDVVAVMNEDLEENQRLSKMASAGKVGGGEFALKKSGHKCFKCHEIHFVHVELPLGRRVIRPTGQDRGWVFHYGVAVCPGCRVFPEIYGKNEEILEMAEVLTKAKAQYAGKIVNAKMWPCPYCGVEAQKPCAKVCPVRNRKQSREVKMLEDQTHKAEAMMKRFDRKDD